MRWFAIAPLIVFAAIVAFFGIGLFKGDPSVVPSPLVGKPAPEFALGSIPDYRPELLGVSQADLSRGGVSLVNFWASWCAPCRVEHPYLMELGDRPGLTLVGINYKDKPGDAADFLTGLGDPYDKIGRDEDGRAAIAWGVYGVPETYVIDGQGTILLKHVGPLSPEIIAEKIDPLIDPLIAQASPQ